VSLSTESAAAADRSEGFAEDLLARLQRHLLERARATPFATLDTGANTARETLRSMERTYGIAATQYGRRLHDLLTGTTAWMLFERPKPRSGRRLPQIRELSACEPLLRVMRESGELAERERCLQARDAALITISQDPTVGEPMRRQLMREADDRFFADLARIGEAYRSYYQGLRRATGTIPPLIGPRIRSRPMLQPAGIAHLFAACHGERATLFTAVPEEPGAFVYRSGRHALTLRPGPGEESPPFELLDEITWDIAAIAICALFVRTSGRDINTPFPLLVDDYFDWRGVDPRKRTLEMRQEIDSRIRLLVSDQLVFQTAIDLWLADPATGRRQKTAIETTGNFLVRRSGLYRPRIWHSEAENEPLYGHMVTLGEWARVLAAERAMIGVFPRALAEYDLRRQQWERRIGWYLTFQMQNQGSKMTFEEVVSESGNRAVQVTPQHALRMKTVLANSHVGWAEMARTNPGKVIKQWIEALETLQAEGVIGGYTCLDGAADGSDLPTRSRLSTMLEYRYQFLPGTETVKQLRLKAAARRNRLKPPA